MSQDLQNNDALDEGKEFSGSERIKKVNPFKVPEGFFESFPAEVMDRIETGAIRNTRPVRMITRGRMFAAAAAVLIIMIVAGTWLIKRQMNYDLIPDIDVILSSTMIHDLDDQFLSEYLIGVSGEADSEILSDSTFYYSALELMVDSSVHENDIIDYLLDIGLTESELMNL